MRDTYTENSDADQSEQESHRRRLNRNIPKRRGSKYADILLQRLQSSVLADSTSGLIGLLSIGRRQGVTTMAVNLAIRAADHNYTPTLIMDGNFSNTRISKLYRHSGRGLAECLNGSSELSECVKATRIEGLQVLGAGKGSVTRQMLFDADLAGEFFKMVKHEYRFAAIDLPSISEPSLNESILPHLDGVVMVARYGTRKDQLVQMQNKIVAANGQVVGAVMNGNQDKLPGWLPGFLG